MPLLLFISLSLHYSSSLYTSTHHTSPLFLIIIMSFLFTAFKDYVYSGEELATDKSASSKNASSSTSEQEKKEMRPPAAIPYSSASTEKAERIIVAPLAPPTVTLSVPTFALDTGANSDSDSDTDDSDDDSDADVPKPSQQTPQLNLAPYGAVATTTLLSAEDLEGTSTGTVAEYCLCLT